MCVCVSGCVCVWGGFHFNTDSRIPKQKNCGRTRKLKTGETDEHCKNSTLGVVLASRFATHCSAKFNNTNKVTINQFPETC